MIIGIHSHILEFFHTSLDFYFVTENLNLILILGYRGEGKLMAYFEEKWQKFLSLFVKFSQKLLKSHKGIGYILISMDKEIGHWQKKRP